MKKTKKDYSLLLMAIIFLIAALCSCNVQAQNAKQNADGNYTAINRAKDTTGTSTGKTFTDGKGNVFPLFQSAKGKLYYFRISKTGNTYKQYLKLEN